MSGPYRGLAAWVNERTGIQGLLRAALDEPIPGGSRWAYIFGSGLLLLLFSQFLTGVFLALYYVPAANDAHITVAYIVKVVSAGAFVRSLHVYGASALVIVLLLHITQTFMYGSYKGRRELLWLAGCVLLLLVLGMAFTGYLLPWDERAYFATAVGTNVMGEVPGGNVLRSLLRGGSRMGTLTLSRFYVLHLFVLPVLLVGFVFAHVYLFRRAGPAGPASADPFEPRLPTERFYPRQLMKDSAFAVLLVGALAALSYWLPAQLGPEANPANTTFLPRPEWYYLPLFEWLKFWPGRTALVGVVAVPAILAALFVLVPWLDRSLERLPWRRPLAAGLFAVVLAGLIGLGVLSHWQDMHNPIVALQLAHQQRETEAYLRAPFRPLPAPNVTAPAVAVPTVATAADAARPGAATTVPADPVAAGAREFATRNCGFCHGDQGEGSDQAPSLQAKVPTLSDAQLAAFLRNPDETAQSVGMPSFDGTPAELHSLIAFLRSLPKPKQ